ncbi:S8 family serine peptidase [Actinoplanes sp. NPDC051861]|uniref:S8 family serine peptidase n=1 Tax=Actinoplanes sp. NPDC051861 TaxID=3155170 RepID=UPI003447B3E2
MRAVSSGLIMAMLAVGVASPARAAEADPVRLDVGLAAGTDPAAVVAGLGENVRFKPVQGLDAIAVDVPADRVEATLAVLVGTAGVRYAQRGGLVQADSEFLNSAFRTSEVTQAWTWTKGSADVTVAVVDTGVSPTADVTADRLTEGYDFVDGDTDATDRSSHGTLVANAIGADHDNDAGISGVCDSCRIMPVRVLSDRGTAAAEGTTADVAAGITWAADHGARIINLSLSTAAESRLLEDAVEYAADKGALVVASAGNEFTTAHRYPAAYESTLSVGRNGSPRNTATDRWVDVAASSSMTVLDTDGQRRALGGTSASTAIVSGVAALAFAIKPSATAEEVRDQIQRDALPSTVRPAADPPLVNAAQVIHHLGGTDSVPPVVTTTGLTENELMGPSGKLTRPTVSDDHGVERVEYRIGDEVLATAYQEPWWVTLMPPFSANGPTPVTVRAYDYAGNAGDVTTVVEMDTKVPNATFVEPAPLALTHHSVDVVLRTSDTDIARIESVHPNGTGFAWDAVAKVWRGRAGVRTDGDQFGSIDIHIHDRAGNFSSLHRQVRVDNEPPAGGWVTPAHGRRFRGAFVATLSGLDDLSGMPKAELWANGKYVGADFAEPYELTVRPGTYSGNVILTWRVTDRFGQWRHVPDRLVIADNRAPSVSISKAPKNKAKVKGTVKVYVKASDASGVARVELIVNGKVVSRDATAGYVLSVNTKKQKKTMKVRVRAYDKLGNVTYTTIRTWYRK